MRAVGRPGSESSPASLPSAEPGKLAGQVTLCCLEMLARERTVRALVPFPGHFPPLLLLSTSIPVQLCPHLSYEIPGESGELLPSSQVGPRCREVESGLGVGQAPQLKPAQRGPEVWEPQLRTLGHLWAATSVCVCTNWGQAGK